MKMDGNSRYVESSALGMENPIRVIAQIVAKAGKEDQVKSVLVSLARPTRNEYGCLQYELLQSCRNPSEFVLIEEWETQASLDRHTAATHTRIARAKVENWLEIVPLKVKVQTYQTII